MATYSYTPSVGEVGGAPSGWAGAGGSDGAHTYTVVDAGSGRYAIRVAGGTSNVSFNALQWNSNSNPPAFDNGETYIRFRFRTELGSECGMALRVGGSNTNYTAGGFAAYWLRARSIGSNEASSQYREYNDGAGPVNEITGSSIASAIDVDMHLMFKCDGSTISYKLWKEGGSEPSYSTTTDSTLTGSALLRLHFGHPQDTDIYFVGVGTGGDAAPRGGGGSDATAPTLTSPASAATGKDAGSGTVTTNEANGTLYSVVTLTSTPPSAAQVKAGQNASGVALAAGLKPTLAISSTGAKTVAYTGPTTATAYFPYFMHEDSSGNQSTVSAGASFTPSTLAYSGTIGAQTGTQGAAFVWSGANPSTLFSGGIGTKTYSGTGLSGSGLTVNSTTGVLSGTCGTPGTYNVAIVGTDQSTAGSEIPQTETSNTFTLTITASGDTTRPTMGGVVTASSVTSNSAVISWSAASDNSGTIAGYDYQVNGGSFVSLGNVLTTTLTGLVSSTAHTVNVRARDPSGNVSTPLITGGFTTGSGAAGTFVSAALKRNNGVLVASSSLTWVTFLNAATGAFVVTKTGLSTNASGIFSTTDAALTTGTYHAVWLEASGQRGWGVASIA